MDSIFPSIAVVLGVLCTYIIIREGFSYEHMYRNNYGYIFFYFLGIFLLVIPFVEMTLFFGWNIFIVTDNIGVWLQLHLMGYASVGQSEKYYLREYSCRNNMNLDVKRIKEINDVQVSIIVVILICFWL